MQRRSGLTSGTNGVPANNLPIAEETLPEDLENEMEPENENEMEPENENGEEIENEIVHDNDNDMEDGNNNHTSDNEELFDDTLIPAVAALLRPTSPVPQPAQPIITNNPPRWLIH